MNFLRSNFLKYCSSLNYERNFGYNNKKERKKLKFTSNSSTDEPEQIRNTQMRTQRIRQTKAKS